jgi:NADH-quinone oxidoreductase subunit D
MAAVIPIGPYHPALKEPEFFKLYTKGEEVVDVDIRIGYNHRGIEKLSESMTFEQVTFLVERICGICSNVHPLCFVQAVEDIAQIEVPDRARYIRTIIAELERIHSHLLWVGVAGHLIGFDTLLMWSWKWREPILDIFEIVTGNRQNYAMMAVGGVRRDIKPEHVPLILRTMKETKKNVRKLIGMVMEDRVTRARLERVGILTKEDARKYCVVGPTARGSGLQIDVRKDHPYAAYKELSFEVPVRNEGDVMARTVVRLEELIQSVEIVEQAVSSLPGGDIRAEFKEVPPGEGIGQVEAPRGEDIHYVKSNGTNMPERHKVRAPSYVNIPSLKPQLIGYTIADAPIIIGSIDPCFSCTDRVSVVDVESGEERILTEEEFIELSRKHGTKV